MFCPEDGNVLNPIQVKAHYGWVLNIDQCPKCQGMWFDKGELISVSPKEAIKIDQPKEEKLAEFPHGLCPNCHQILADFSDPAIPNGIKVHWCKKCEGFWLTRGSLLVYKKFQEEKIQWLRAKTLKEEHDKIKEYINQTPLEFASKIMMQPVSGQTWVSNESPTQQELITNGVLTVLQLLVRIFLRSK